MNTKLTNYKIANRLLFIAILITIFLVDAANADLNVCIPAFLGILGCSYISNDYRKEAGLDYEQ